MSGDPQWSPFHLKTQEGKMYCFLIWKFHEMVWLLAWATIAPMKKKNQFHLMKGRETSVGNNWYWTVNLVLCDVVLKETGFVKHIAGTVRHEICHPHKHHPGRIVITRNYGYSEGCFSMMSDFVHLALQRIIKKNIQCSILLQRLLSSWAS